MDRRRYIPLSGPDRRRTAEMAFNTWHLHCKLDITWFRSAPVIPFRPIDLSIAPRFRIYFTGPPLPHPFIELSDRLPIVHSI